MANRVFHVAFLAALAAGCSEDKPLGFEAGPLGAVEVDADAAVQVRSMLPLTGLQNISESIQKAIELAVEDYGPIHGRAVSLGQPIDTMCSSDGGDEGARQIAADPQVVGVIGPTCSEASVGASPVLSAAGLAMISPANASPDLKTSRATEARTTIPATFAFTATASIKPKRSLTSPISGWTCGEWRPFTTATRSRTVSPRLSPMPSVCSAAKSPSPRSTKATRT